jgi:lipopolysaccharide/colanic/teichoic acid biosynthesis glycosyltransferase
VRRILDITIAGLALVLLSPLYLLIMAMLRCSGEGEVFFCQDRVGKGGKLIRLTKFATMLKASPALGTGDLTLPNDPRVLPFGRFLRRSKLNELPQFWDVFTGKMSLIGWRPLLPAGFANYPDWVQAEILKIKPGLTGVGSLAFRDEEAIVARAAAEGHDLKDCYRDEIMPYKGALEVWYVRHRGFWTDFKVFAGTVVAVFCPAWHGFRGWFQNLPVPESKMVRECLGFDPGRSEPTGSEV